MAHISEFGVLLLILQAYFGGACKSVDIVDGSFELGALTWHPIANPSEFTVHTGSAQSGTHYISVTDGGARQSFDFSSAPIKSFTLSGYSRHSGQVTVVNPADYSILCDLDHTDGSETWALASKFDPSSPPNTWEYRQLVVNSTKDIKDAWCYAMFRNGQGTVDFDNFKINTCYTGVQTPAVSSCQDLDTQACVLFQTAKPNLCSDPAFSQSTCKRFCGQCPLECYSCPTPVRDPANCHTTTTCPVNSTCMTKELKAADGHHEYIMSCEKKTVCDGFNFGFAIGKRALFDEETDDDVEDHGRQERDISLSCCDTDFCNVPMTTTVTPPTTAAPKCARDVVFAVDDSGSIGSTNFKHAMDFVRGIISSLTIGPVDNQISVMTYSSHPQIDWYLSTFQTKSANLNALNKVLYHSGVTRTGDALEAVRTKILTLASGDRPNNENVVIVVSDGQSTDKSDTLHEANRLHTVSRDVISIVVGSGVDQNELNAIATDRHHVIDVRGYSNLAVLIPQVVNLICG